MSSSKRIAEGDDVARGRLVDARVRRGVRARGCAPWRGGGDAELGTRRIEKQKRGHSSPLVPRKNSTRDKFAENSQIRVCTGFEPTTAALLQNQFFRPRFLSHFAGSRTWHKQCRRTGKTTSRNASRSPRKLPVTVSRSERASTALHAARSFHRRAPASRHRAHRRRTRDRCVPPGERRPRRRAPAERRAARASRPDRDHSERRIVLSRLERTGRAAA